MVSQKFLLAFWGLNNRLDDSFLYMLPYKMNARTWYFLQTPKLAPNGEDQPSLLPWLLLS